MILHKQNKTWLHCNDNSTGNSANPIEGKIPFVQVRLGISDIVSYPDPNLGVIGGLFDDFRRHPEWRADKRPPLGHGVGQLSGDAKVSELDIALLG